MASSKVVRLASRAALKKLRTINDTRYDVVQTPEWSDAGFDAVRVRSLTSGEKDAYEDGAWVEQGRGQATTRVQSFRDARARLVVIGCVDESGEPLFEAEDMPWLTQRNSAPMQRLWEKILELSNMEQKAAVRLGEGSAADPSGDSASDSPSPSASQ